MAKPLIYFLCTGNSCRSQMAEGIGKKILGDRYDVYSAGIEAHGLNPRAIEAMNEVGIDISKQTSDVINPDLLERADYVITLCGHANDVCPMTPAHKNRMHWGFDDPAQATGTEEDIRDAFRSARDAIQKQIKLFSIEGGNKND